ncbi:MAG: SH3 domain-containing protein [Chloroflexota bacterium]
MKPRTIFITFLILAVSLACTLEAPGAAVLEVQNTPTPQAATPTQTKTFLPVRTGETQTALPIATATLPHQAARCTVNTTALNVRACAGLDCAAVAWLYAGDIVTITHQARAWLEVNTGELTGFVKTEFCEVKP